MKLADLVNGKVVAVSGDNQTDDMKLTIEKGDKEYLVSFGSRCSCGVGVDIEALNSRKTGGYSVEEGNKHG